MSDVPERLKKALDAIEYMPNAVYAWEKAHQGDRSLARRNAEKVREAERLLGEILASLPAALSYEVYGLKQKPLRFESKRDLIAGVHALAAKRARLRTRAEDGFDVIFAELQGDLGHAPSYRFCRRHDDGCRKGL